VSLEVWWSLLELSKLDEPIRFSPELEAKLPTFVHIARTRGT
jgi:hypothetical protein